MRVPAEPFPRLGDYQLVRKLGEGGMAEIFLAKRFGAAGFVKTVVIKRIRAELSHKPRFVSMFRDEARIAAKLDHPCIGQVMDFGEAGGSYFICMEYVAGQDLRSILVRCAQNGTYLPTSAALRITASVLEALEYAHEFAENGRPLQVVHRDVSPTNVMVSYSGPVKVLDFGIARAASRLTRTLDGELTGKTSYVAPEQVRGLAVDRRADLWGVGLILFEALTNQRVFTQPTEHELMAAILEAPIRSPASVRPELPEDVCAIVHKALERDLNRRYRSAAAMRADVDRALAKIAPGGGAGELAQVMADLFEATHPHRPAPTSEHDVTRSIDPPLPPREVVPRPAPPSRRWYPALAAAALSVAVGLGVWSLRRGGPPAAVVPRPAPMATAPAAAPPVPAAPALPATVAGLPTQPDPPAPDPAPPLPPASKREGRAAPLRPLSPREAGSAFGRARSKLLECFNQHSESLSQLEGQLTLSVVVGQSGAVREASITSPPVGSPALNACIVERVRKIQFRRQPDNDVRINVPFVYRVTH